MIKVDVSHAIQKIDFDGYAKKIEEINRAIDEKTGAGSDFLGWANYPETYDKEEFARIQKAGDFIKSATFIAFVPLIGTAVIYFVIIKFPTSIH